jgi:uncharacterized membrane protein HdeD (DUF308 family)
MLRVLINNWWLFGLRGICTLLFAIATFFLLAFPQGWLVQAIASAWLVVLFGVLAFSAGVFTILAALRGSNQRGDWWLLVVDGGAVCVAGLIAVLVPDLTLISLIRMIAFAALFVGVCELGAARKLRRHIADERFLLLAGAGSLGFGAFLLVGWPHYLESTFKWLGAYASFSALTMLCLAVRLRSLHNLPHVLVEHATSVSKEARK